MTTLMFDVAETYTFDLAKGSGQATVAWDKFPNHILAKLLEYGVKQKVTDGYSQIKSDVAGYAESRRKTALDLIDAMYAGAWGGRVSDPVGKHARTIASAWAATVFDGLVMTKDTVTVKTGSQAEKTLAAIAKGRGVKASTLDPKAEWVRAVETRMLREDVQAEAKRRADADAANAAELTDDDLAGLV